MALPDIATSDWQRDQADLFRQLTNAKIGAAQFAQTTGQQIADATQRIAALATAPAPTPPAMPSSLEGPSTRAAQQPSQPLDMSPGSAPSAPTMPVQPFSGGGPSVDTSQASGSRGGSFGDFASGLIDQARQRVAALSGGTPADTSGGPTPGPLTMPRPEGTITPPDVVGNAADTVSRVASQVNQAGQAYNQGPIAAVIRGPLGAPGGVVGAAGLAGQAGLDYVKYRNSPAGMRERGYSDQYINGGPMLSQDQAAWQRETDDIVMGVAGGGDLPISREIGTQVGKVAGEAAAPIAEGIGARVGGAVQRFFHGTGSAFDRPDAMKFDPNGLFGPGYYLSDSPEIASSYASNRGISRTDTATGDIRQWRQQLDQITSELRTQDYPTALRQHLTDTIIPDLQAKIAQAEQVLNVGPNVRAVNVPSGLRLLDADAVATPADVSAVRQAVAQTGFHNATTFEDALPTGRVTGEDVYKALNRAGEGDKEWVNAQVQRAGYDGITYAGGKRVPLMDATGQPIQHTAVVIFPESLPKITNAISGTTMGSPPAIGGAVLGGVLGASQGDTPEERARNAVLGAASGAVGGHLLASGSRAAGLSIAPTSPAWLNEVLAPVKNAAPEVQNAVADFAGRRGENAVVADTWARRAALAAGDANKSHVPGATFERTGQIAANPTPEQQAFARDLEAHINFTGDVGRQSGYITGDVRTGQPGAPTNYFPHIYQDTLTTAQQQARGKGGLNPSDFYSNGRVFPTLDEAVAAGKKPIGFSDSVRIYTQHVLDSEAKVQLVKDLRNASPAAVMDTPSGTRIPTGWRAGGGIDPRFQGVAFPEPVARVIENVLGTSEIGKYAAGRALQGGLGEAKSTLFSLSFFHPTTLALQALRANPPQYWPKIVGTAVQNLVVPGAYDTMRLARSDSFREAARDGLTGLTAGVRGPDVEQGIGRFKGAALRAVTGGLSLGYGGYENAKARGADEPTAIGEGLKYGVAGAVGGAVVAPRINAALWENLAPTLKVMTYEIAKNSTGDGRAAAAFANRTFGGNNLAMVARAPLVQDVARLGVLAPDWWEGWARQVGSAAIPGAAGNLSRSYWLRTAATAAVTLEGLNKAFSGHFTDQNDPEHRYDLEVTGLYDQMGWHRNDPTTGMPIRKYWDILGPIRSMMQATGGVQQAEQFGTGRLGILPRTAQALISNQDTQGKPIVPPYASDLGRLGAQAGYALGQVAPIGGQQAVLTGGAKEPLPVQAISTLGLARPVTTAKGAEVYPQMDPALHDTLTRGGVTWTPRPVGSAIGTVPLTRDERTQYQTLANQYRDRAVSRLVADPGWARATSTARQRAVDDAIRQGDAAARAAIAGKIGPAEAQRRVAQQKAGQAVTP